MIGHSANFYQESYPELMKPSRLLLQRHAHILRKSGISYATARRHGIASSLSGCSYIMPVHDIHGTHSGRVTRIDDDAIVSYPSSEGRLRRFVTLGDDNAVPKVHFPFVKNTTWNEIAKNPYQSIFITEGIKKSITLCEEGYPCLGLLAMNGAVNRTGHLCHELQAIRWKDRHVYLVFDNDKAIKPNVQSAETRLKEALEAKGAKVHIVNLPYDPRIKGADDFLSGSEDHRRLFQASLHLAEQRR